MTRLYKDSHTGLLLLKSILRLPKSDWDEYEEFIPEILTWIGDPHLSNLEPSHVLEILAKHSEAIYGKEKTIEVRLDSM